MVQFSLNTDSGVPFYRQIMDQIRLGIASGKIQPGEQLPTVRALAVDLQINFHTVNKAYKELEWQNIVTTQQGTGTFVTHDCRLHLRKSRTSWMKLPVNLSKERTNMALIPTT